MPSTTLQRGSSATHTGKPVSSLILLFKFRKSALVPRHNFMFAVLTANPARARLLEHRVD